MGIHPVITGESASTVADMEVAPLYTALFPVQQSYAGLKMESPGDSKIPLHRLSAHHL